MEIMEWLCATIDVTNINIMTRAKPNDGIPDAGWKVLETAGNTMLVMRRSDGARFRLTVEQEQLRVPVKRGRR